jgi:GNAT superfamily N-acetyltransferase
VLLGTVKGVVLATKSATVGDTLSLRRLRRRDIRVVADIAGDAFENQAVQQKVAEDLTIYCDDGIEERDIRAQRHCLPREYYVVLLNAQEIGLTGLYRFHWAWEREAWLGWTAIDRSRQSKGIGSEVLSVVKDLAYDKGFRVLHVETERYRRAKHFYLRNGFEESGVLPRHYGGNCDALVLSCNLDDQCRSGTV